MPITVGRRGLARHAILQRNFADREPELDDGCWAQAGRGLSGPWFACQTVLVSFFAFEQKKEPTKEEWGAKINHGVMTSTTRDHAKEQ